MPVLQTKQTAAQTVRERLFIDTPEQEPLAEGAGAGDGGDGGRPAVGGRRRPAELTAPLSETRG